MKIYIIYSYREIDLNKNPRPILGICHTLEKAKQEIRETWENGIIYSYEVVDARMVIDGPRLGLMQDLSNEHLESIMHLVP